MKFSKWPYWLRGGVIGTIIGVILDIPPLLCYLFVGGFLCINISPMIFSGIFLSVLPILNNYPPLFSITLISLLLSFLIGSIIGIFIDRIKKIKFAQ